MENNSIKYIVYCTTCTVNKKIYVGVHRTNKPDEFDGYLGNGIYANQPSTYNTPKYRFQYAVKKYGPKSFIRQTLAIYDNEEDALMLESEIVNEEFLKRTDVYNTALGGKAGGQIVQSIETYQYSADGEFITTHKSINYAAQTINRSMRTLWRAIKDKCKCAGYFWTTEKYDKLDLSKMKSYEGPHKIPVFQYDENGNFECCYDSIHDASKITGYTVSEISKHMKLGICCKHKFFTSVYAPSYDIAKSTQITSQEIHQYDLDGNYIKSYKNMQQAKNELKIKANIYQSIKLGQLCGGYQWSFEKLPQMPSARNKKGRVRKVGKFDKDWNLLEEYPSLAACKKANGSGMEHVIRGRDEFAKGFRYKYLD